MVPRRPALLPGGQPPPNSCPEATVTQHRIARADLDVALVKLVRSGERIDTFFLSADETEWVVVTEDRIETRPTHAERLGVTR